MGLLSDIYSYGDTLKRKMGGLLSDPAGVIGLGGRRFAEDQQGLLNLMDQAGYTPGMRSILQSPQSRQQAAGQLADKSMESLGGLLGATVYHGSPHKFDKFDSSKIGTGEGAQAYGHGLYLAEKQGTAGTYQTAGKPSFEIKYKGQDIPQDHILARAISAHGGDISKTEQWLKAEFQRSPDGQIANALDVLKNKALLSANEIKGNLYKVDLPDEHIAKMLDWDKPLSQQPPEVQKAFEPHVAGLREQFAKPAPGWGDLGAAQTYDPTGKELLGLLRKRDATTAQDFLGNGLGRDVSERLRAQGIPGIRYLDGGSRGAGAGTSNYVVFPGNEGLLKILERNGIPVK